MPNDELVCNRSLIKLKKMESDYKYKTIGFSWNFNINFRSGGI